MPLRLTVPSSRGGDNDSELATAAITKGSSNKGHSSESFTYAMGAALRYSRC